MMDAMDVWRHRSGAFHQKKSPRSASAQHRPTLFDGTAGMFDRAVGGLCQVLCRVIFACRDMFPCCSSGLVQAIGGAEKARLNNLESRKHLTSFPTPDSSSGATSPALLHAAFTFYLLGDFCGFKICQHAVRRTEIHPRGSRAPRAGYCGPYARRAKTGMSFHANFHQFMRLFRHPVLTHFLDP